MQEYANPKFAFICKYPYSYICRKYVEICKTEYAQICISKICTICEICVLICIICKKYAKARICRNMQKKMQKYAKNMQIYAFAR